MLSAPAQAAKNRKAEGVNFLGTARSCGKIYCDPGLLMRGLGSGACGKCSEGKQAWLKKSPTLESFDKDLLFNFIFHGMKAIFIKKIRNEERIFLEKRLAAAS